MADDCHDENGFYGHISALDLDCPMCIKFCNMLQKQNKWWINKRSLSFQYSRWQTAAILKIIKSPYLSELISTDFY